MIQDWSCVFGAMAISASILAISGVQADTASAPATTGAEFDWPEGTEDCDEETTEEACDICCNDLGDNVQEKRDCQHNCRDNFDELEPFPSDGPGLPQ